MLRTCACANAALLYLLIHSNVNLSGVIWHCATEIHSIAWLFRDGHIRRYQFTSHDSFVMVTLGSISLHYTTLKINTTATEIYFRHSSFVWTPPSCVASHPISRRVRFASSRKPAKPAFYRYWRGKLVVSELFTMMTHPASVGWTMGFNNKAHYYSTRQLAYAFKTHEKHTKTHKKLNWLSLSRFSLLLPNCKGSHFALIYKFKDVNLNMSGGGPLVMAALFSEWYERLLN